MTQRWRSVTSVVLIVALFALIGMVFLFMPPERNIADREQVGSIITAALNAYFEDHGEYPPFLLGDTAPPFDLIPELLFCRNEDGTLYTPRIIELYGQDPLLEDGYLSNYPCVSPQPRNPESRSMCQSSRLRGVRWQCSVYTPLGERLADRGIKLYTLPGDDVTEQYKTRRLFALGGVSHIMPDATEIHDYAVSDALGINLRFVEMTSFGYTRGEWIGLSSQQAWLWFYYPREESLIIWMSGKCRQSTRGLDLLNASIGEFAPDGIRDGVMLLYKLDAGQVEAIRPPASK